MNRVERGRDSADFVALILSEASVRSQRGRQDFNLAISRQVSRHRRDLLPISRDDTEVSALLREVMYLDMRTGDIESGIARLVAAIKRRQVGWPHTSLLKRA